MKRSILIFAFFNFLIATAVAQPKLRRNQVQTQAQQKQQRFSGERTIFQQMMFEQLISSAENG